MTRSYITPPNTRIYAIGDLHGHREACARMLALIEEDMRGRHIKNVKVVFLGDYVDRGPDSAGLLDDLIALKARDTPYDTYFLRGNHEGGMIGFLSNPLGPRRDWLEWGGIETLESYGITPHKKAPLDRQLVEIADQLKEALPGAHAGFLSSLKMYKQIGDFLFVHAGIRPNFPLHEQIERDLLGIRKGFLDYEGLHPWRVVHGHTIMSEPEILPGRINVDTGLYKNGVLSCAVIENDHVDIMQVRA